MFKKSSVLFFFLLSISFGFGQTKEIDSLKEVLKSSKVSLKRADAYQQLGWLNIRRDLALAKKYIDSSHTIYKASNNRDQALKLNYKYAAISRYEGNFNSALNYIDEYLKYVVKNGKPENISKGYYEKGVIYQLIGKYEESLKEYYKALKIDEDTENIYGVGITFNSIGIVHKKLRQYSRAEDYFLRAIEIHEKAGDDGNLANALSSLGSNYGEQGKDEKAIEYFKKCLELDVKLENQWAIASDYQNIGIGYANLNRHEKGIEYLKKALIIQQENRYNSDMVFVMMSMGASYIKNENLDEAEKILLEVLDLDSEALQTNKDAHKNLAKLYKKKRDLKNSIKHLEIYTKLKDSIFKEEGLKSMNKLQVQYQTEKKDKEIAEQKLVVADKQLALNKSKSKTRTMNIIIISLLIASMLLWFLFQQRQKRIQQQLVAVQREQEVKTLESLMEGEEKERFRIAKELHDGVNGDLSAIKFKLSSLLEMNNTVIKEAVSMIDNSCEQVRAISHNLVPPSLKNFNLVEAVEEYCQSMNSIHEPEVHFQEVGNAITLDKKEEANLFRIIQELVTNSIKHAQATEINVQLSSQANILQLSIEDNGKGFDPKGLKSKGIGMQNVQSRINYLNAIMDFTSNKKGTAYTITIDKKAD